MKKNYIISIPVNFFWKRLCPGLIIFGIVGTIAGLLFVDNIIMPNVVGVNRDVVTVPKVVALPFDDARESLFKNGLLTEIRNREYDDSIPADAIISQFPEASSRVKKGRKIAVVISKGKEIGIIPDIRNISERQARILLKKSGFTIGETKKKYSDDHPIDVVIDAFPKSGTTTSREVEVEIYLSKGPRPTHAEVPNLVGESLKNAKAMVTESGLTLGKISYQNNSSLLPGTIISQSSAPGSRVPLESPLNLVVSVIR
jgi:eukaryotic-like serine/threonine-protein kinase